MLENLDRFILYCRNLTPRVRRWLHQLRTLGNDNRHVKRTIGNQDAELAFAILLRWLHWYFCEHLPRDRRLPTLLIQRNQALDSLLSDEVANLMERMDRAEEVDADFVNTLQLDNPNSLFLMTPILPAVLIEALIGRKRFEEADRVLQAARREFPKALRLAQLQGLYHSRLGRTTDNVRELERARRILEEVPTVDSAADEETLGMLAGVLKELSDRKGDDVQLLKKSQHTYQRGWERSRERNNYLGINAATTALWLDDSKAAAQIGSRVRTNLLEIQKQLAEAEDGPYSLSFWDQMTLGEALLLAGEFDEAGRIYRTAFTEFAANVGDIEVARKQARKILARLKQGDLAAEILGK
jgi:tetratricopeptide (TPR) repeat protein